MREKIKLLEVFATGQVGRQLVREIWRKQGNALYTIMNLNDKGEVTSFDRGGRTVAATKLICSNILRNQRYTDVEFKNAS